MKMYLLVDHEKAQSLHAFQTKFVSATVSEPFDCSRVNPGP